MFTIVGAFFTVVGILLILSNLFVLKDYPKRQVRLIDFIEGTSKTSDYHTIRVYQLKVEYFDERGVRHEIVGTERSNCWRYRIGDILDVYMSQKKEDYDKFRVAGFSFWIFPMFFFWGGLLALYAGLSGLG